MKKRPDLRSRFKNDEITDEERAQELCYRNKRFDYDNEEL